MVVAESRRGQKGMVRLNRRQKTAEETREKIVAAGRKLIGERGYAQARVEDIAKLAGVATVTVYTSVGGKGGVLQALIEQCGEFQKQTGFNERTAASTDAIAILEDSAHTMSIVRQEFEDVIYAMHDAAPFDATVEKMLAQATRHYHGLCEMIAGRLKKIGGLRRGLSVARATDLLWYYFGWWSWYTLHNENGWTYDESEKWLLLAVKRSLLPDVDS